jgi:hypothetical protein
MSHLKLTSLGGSSFGCTLVLLPLFGIWKKKDFALMMNKGDGLQRLGKCRNQPSLSNEDIQACTEFVGLLYRSHSLNKEWKRGKCFNIKSAPPTPQKNKNNNKQTKQKTN